MVADAARPHEAAAGRAQNRRRARGCSVIRPQHPRLRKTCHFVPARETLVAKKARAIRHERYPHRRPEGHRR